MIDQRSRIAILAIAALLLAARLSGEDSFELERAPGSATISRGRQKLATYAWEDAKILRPYWAHVCVPGGMQVTRNHPPVAGKDVTDHETMHPGIWLAFGDLSGNDFWRNKGAVTSEVRELTADRDSARLSFDLEYRAGEAMVARESRQLEVRASGPGLLFTIDSTLTPGGDVPLAFGDQEEMGLGVRLATPLAVKGGGGVITNSEGRKNEEEVWGRPAAWCDYSATLAGRRTGILLMPHPENFRKSWMHVRDYGLMVANPFGQRAFTGGEKSVVAVKPGEKLRLRFGVLAYSSADQFDPADAYAKYAGERGASAP